jgi:hypothetical protein
MPVRSVMSRLVIASMVAACGGSDGSSINPEERCSLLNESYDAFSAADGARCGETDGSGYCYEGDLCREAGVCELVASVTTDAYCALLRAPYDAFSSADGARCGSSDGSGYCFAGDHCRQEGVCEAVLSAANGKPHAELFGQRYDAFTSADGARCGTGDGAGYCLAGDRCVEPGTCVLVLQGLGGQVQAQLIGSMYTASSGADGGRCGEGDGAGYCKAGDRCVSPGTCEVVLSAWTP